MSVNSERFMFKFYREVREQILRVTPPTWREVWVTAIMVVIFALIMAFFIFGADALIITVRDFLVRLISSLLG